MTRAEVLQLLLDVLDEVDNAAAVRRVRKLLRAEESRACHGCPCKSHHPSCDCGGAGGDR